MLGLAHTLHSEDLHDKAFLSSHCVGYERFVPYLLGQSDGVPKDADWAAAICDIDAGPDPRTRPPDGEASPASCRSAGRCSGPRTAISPTG